VTEQELAVSGLNFRIKCFHMKDSLFTEIFVVNHSDLVVKLDTSKIDMIIDDLSMESADAAVVVEKVTGSKEAVDILAKGDRIIIKMRRKVVDHPDELLLSFSNSFFLTTGKPLFKEDLRMIISSN
jgi:hypothetical protein